MSDLKISHLESQIDTLRQRLDEAQTRAQQAEAALERRTIEMAVRTAVAEASGAAGVGDDLSAKALREGQWRVDTSDPAVLRQQVKTWMAEVKKTSPWFFADAKEMVAKSRDEPPNPWSAEHWNLTKQSRVAAISLDEARRLARAAGSDLHATQPPAPKAKI
jgi:hypothetical protein